LTEKLFGRPEEIYILLETDHYFNMQLMQAKCMSLKNSKLGWIVAGKIAERAPTSPMCAVLTEGEKVDEKLVKFWELDHF